MLSLITQLLRQEYSNVKSTRYGDERRANVLWHDLAHFSFERNQPTRFDGSFEIGGWVTSLADAVVVAAAVDVVEVAVVVVADAVVASQRRRSLAFVAMTSGGLTR